MADGGRRRSSVVSISRNDDGIVRVTDNAVRRLSVTHADIGREQEDARAAFNAEQSMTVRQSIRLYKKAIIFSMAMSLAVVMEG
jgi:MFS transporter, SP family, general alpha glucoside:H+ symporter